MYKLLLIRKYLLKRRIAWVALLAVMLCTAMVLVVISVMGGWLEMFKTSFRGMTSDVVVQAGSLVGFPYYDEMLNKIRALPEVQAAAPAIHTFGLINIGNQRRRPVEVWGYSLDDIGKVSDFPKTLGRQWDIEKKQNPSFDLLPDVNYKLFAGRKAKDDVLARPGMIVSDPLIDVDHGEPAPNYIYELPTTLTLLRVLPGQAISAQDSVSPAFWIVDDSRSRIYQVDNNRIYVPLAVLQNYLQMNEGDNPARVSEIQIKAKPGFDLMNVRAKVDAIVQNVVRTRDISDEYPISVSTWQQIQGDFIDAVEHEVVLTTALFGIISLVAVLLIFCIFYMIVVEKTKDIGIIKSVGATGGGILQLFLGYGFAIGIVGSGLGVVLAYLVVHNINQLHSWLSTRMHITIWNPKTYQFDMIPNQMSPRAACSIVVVAILSALLGALVPAIRAARMNPVEALRYE